MVEVFITNVKAEKKSREVLRKLVNKYPFLKFDFDLEDFNKPYPCGHSILRVEGDNIDANILVQELQTLNIKCEILEDKICK